MQTTIETIRTASRRWDLPKIEAGTPYVVKCSGADWTCTLTHHATVADAEAERLALISAGKKEQSITIQQLVWVGK